MLSISNVTAWRFPGKTWKVPSTYVGCTVDGPEAVATSAGCEDSVNSRQFLTKRKAASPAPPSKVDLHVHSSQTGALNFSRILAIHRSFWSSAKLGSSFSTAERIAFPIRERVSKIVTFS
jgi:hypothetical protein